MAIAVVATKLIANDLRSVIKRGLNADMTLLYYFNIILELVNRFDNCQVGIAHHTLKFYYLFSHDSIPPFLREVGGVLLRRSHKETGTTTVVQKV